MNLELHLFALGSWPEVDDDFLLLYYSAVNNKYGWFAAKSQGYGRYSSMFGLAEDVVLIAWITLPKLRSTFEP